MFAADVKIVPLPDLTKPEQLISIDKDRMYIIEGTTIFIYSLKDFKLIKKFGKRGEGPREFITSHQMGPMGALFIDVRSDHILVKSMGKLSWFSKDGNFIKEAKSPTPMMLGIWTFGKQFAVQKYTIGNVRYQTLQMYNEKLEETRELERMEDAFQPGKGILVLKKNPIQAVYKDKMFVCWENDVVIKVMDKDLKVLYTIKHPTKRLKVTEDLKKKIIHFFKTDPSTKEYFEFFKPITFPKYFPAIAQMFVTGDKVYVITFNSDTVSGEFGEIDNNDVLIFDLKGKFLKKVVLPFVKQDPLLNFPLAIHEGKLYQLVEDQDDEEWGVHIREIK
jgi:hypothetical protein